VKRQPKQGASTDGLLHLAYMVIFLLLHLAYLVIFLVVGLSCKPGNHNFYPLDCHPTTGTDDISYDEKFWKLIKDSITYSILSEFYSRIDRKRPSNMVSELGNLEFKP
jgi:hypothetical protein